ncbi:hypothetical protein A4R28_32950 (plasmid) [Mesorhizobium ciceri]|nr:hypothetical protein A4R28_32950 [Mesorhizobium ciceri]
MVGPHGLTEPNPFVTLMVPDGLPEESWSSSYSGATDRKKFIAAKAGFVTCNQAFGSRRSFGAFAVNAAQLTKHIEQPLEKRQFLRLEGAVRDACYQHDPCPCIGRIIRAGQVNVNSDQGLVGKAFIAQ